MNAMGTLAERITVQNIRPIRAELEAPADRQPCLLVVRGKERGRFITIESDKVLLGSGVDSQIQLDDPGISREHACFRRVSGGMILEDLGSTNGSWCNGQRVTRVNLSDGDQLQFGSCLVTFRLNHPEESRWLEQLYHRATQDFLTGLFNRASLEDRLEWEVQRDRRYRRGLAIIQLDLDHFKQVNDRFGHAAGDQVLKAVGGCLMAGLRSCDLAARVGGEEFVVLLPETELRHAKTIAEKIRVRIAGLRIQHQGTAIGITASLGVAAVDDGDSTKANLLASADEACYRAKHAGRNRVECPEPPADRWQDRCIIPFAVTGSPGEALS